MKPHILFSVAALLAGFAVLLGAFGAHGLQDILLESELQTYQTATEYLMYHALALIGVAAMWRQTPAKKDMGLAAVMMLLGVLLFAGSLYLLLLTNIFWLVWITPIGGLLLIVSWLLVAWHGLKMYERSDGN